MTEITYEGEKFYVKIAKRVQLYNPRTNEFVSGVDWRLVESGLE